MDAFEALYERYFKDVYRYILSLCHEAALAEDLTSETFLKALESLDTYRGDCHVRSWLCQIGKNCYFSYLRKNRRLEQLPQMEQSDPGPGIDEEMLSACTSMTLHQALHNLPEPYKEVFSLRVFSEMNYQDIGSLFGKSGNWACVTYYRAKEKLRKEMDRDENKL